MENDIDWTMCDFCIPAHGGALPLFFVCARPPFLSAHLPLKFFFLLPPPPTFFFSPPPPLQPSFSLALLPSFCRLLSFSPFSLCFLFCPFSPSFFFSTCPSLSPFFVCSSFPFFSPACPSPFSRLFPFPLFFVFTLPFFLLPPNFFLVVRTFFRLPPNFFSGCLRTLIPHPSPFFPICPPPFFFVCPFFFACSFSFFFACQVPLTVLPLSPNLFFALASLSPVSPASFSFSSPAPPPTFFLAPHLFPFVACPRPPLRRQVTPYLPFAFCALPLFARASFPPFFFDCLSLFSFFRLHPSLTTSKSSTRTFKGSRTPPIQQDVPQREIWRHEKTPREKKKPKMGAGEGEKRRREI